ncbi:MAG TPA: hypothetical protein VHS28_00570 [Chloroflexota bacterium]|nr:hypothetical protein [Chloroflexota bacterium]
MTTATGLGGGRKHGKAQEEEAAGREAADRDRSAKATVQEEQQVTVRHIRGPAGGLRRWRGIGRRWGTQCAASHVSSDGFDNSEQWSFQPSTTVHRYPCPGVVHFSSGNIYAGTCDNAYA